MDIEEVITSIYSLKEPSISKAGDGEPIKYNDRSKWLRKLKDLSILIDSIWSRLKVEVSDEYI
jgi:gluconate kinase